MSFLRTADEKPIPAKGWLALLLYALGVALVLRVCVYTPQARGDDLKPWPGSSATKAPNREGKDEVKAKEKPQPSPSAHE